MDGKLSTHYTRWAYDEKGLKKNEREKIEFNFSDIFFNRACLTREGWTLAQRKTKCDQQLAREKVFIFFYLYCVSVHLFI